MVYRESPPIELGCPRCSKPLPPVDAAHCICGLWLTAWAANELLTEDELRIDRATHWWKVRAPCPMCGQKMLLRGTDQAHFLGCDGHGFWIDHETIEHTSIGHGVDHQALARKRADQDGMDAAREEAERAAQDRMAELRDKDLREAELAQKLGLGRPAPVPRAQRPAKPKPREPAPPTAEMIEAQRAREAYERVSSAFSREVADYLFDRLAALERRNAELEDRVRRLEARP